MNKKNSVIARFEILLWFYGPERFPGLSRNGPQATVHFPKGGRLREVELYGEIFKS